MLKVTSRVALTVGLTGELPLRRTRQVSFRFGDGSKRCAQPSGAFFVSEARETVIAPHCVERLTDARMVSPRNKRTSCQSIPAVNWRNCFTNMRQTVSRCLVSVLLVSGVAVAQARDMPAAPATPTGQAAEVPQGSSTQQFGAWQVVCPQQPGDCFMRQILYHAASSRPVFEISTKTSGKDKAASVFILTLPLGIHLPKGVAIKVDARPAHRIAVQSCHKGGCIAAFRGTKQILTQLRLGKRLALKINHLDGTASQHIFSLEGFTAAHQFVSSAGKGKP